MEQAREVIQRELEQDIYERLRRIKKSVLEPLQGAGCFSSTGSLDLRRKYASLPAAEVSMAVFSCAEGLFNPRMAKVGSTYWHPSIHLSSLFIAQRSFVMSMTSMSVPFV